MMDKTIQLTCQNPKPRHQGICGGSNTTINCGITNTVVLTHFIYHITMTSLVNNDDDDDDEKEDEEEGKKG